MSELLLGARRWATRKNWDQEWTAYREMRRLGADEDAARQVAAISHRW
jgi:hypothetical protein